MENMNVSLENVRQPKMAAAIIKLREVYVETERESRRGEEMFGAINDRHFDRFVELYNQMTDCMCRILSNNLDAEINEAMPVRP